jgi:acyl-CoA thioester hydrolase
LAARKHTPGCLALAHEGNQFAAQRFRGAKEGFSRARFTPRGMGIEVGNMGDDGWHETKIRIRYKDTDRLGVVYYGNYLTFFEVARAEFMRDLGYPYSRVEAEGFSLVVTEAAVKYHGNVGYDSLVTVKTMITETRGARVRFEYKVLSEDEKLLVTGHTVHGCINAIKKPSRIPLGLKAILEEKRRG